MIKPMVQKALIKSLPHLERAGKKAGDHLLNASKESIKDILKNKKSGKEVLEKQQNALNIDETLLFEKYLSEQLQNEYYKSRLVGLLRISMKQIEAKILMSSHRAETSD